MTFFHKDGAICCIHQKSLHGKIFIKFTGSEALMRKWILLLTALILIIPTAVHAQDATSLKSLNVRLWSEYDQPSMLVIYDLEVSDDTTVPATVDIQIPTGANITAIAYESNGQLLLANYQNNPVQDANWESLTLFITERTNYRVEYYLPLEREGNNRSFTFQWSSNYAIGEFNVDVQVPGDSIDVKTNPAMPFVQGQPSLSGGAMISNLTAGQTYTLKLSYSRTSDAVMASSSAAQVEPVTPVDENTDGRSTLNNLPILLASFGVV